MINRLLSVWLWCLLPGRVGVLSGASLPGPSAVYNIQDYGAQPGNAQASIQRAIEAGAAGSGQVSVPAGVFGTAIRYLRSNVELHRASGTALFALPDSTLYRTDKAGACSVRATSSFRP